MHRINNSLQSFIVNEGDRLDLLHFSAICLKRQAAPQYGTNAPRFLRRSIWRYAYLQIP